jgi:DNA-directed RNA polymerase subunit K
MAEKSAKEEKMEYTKFEKARIIGNRALQISMGAPFLVKVSEKELEKIKYNPVEIAKLEYNAGAILTTVKRPMPLKKEIKKE